MQSIQWEAVRANWGNGFTLVELLVVIGIIAMLIAILLPTLGSAGFSAGDSNMSNLRQWAEAFHMYASQYSAGRCPRTGTNSTYRASRSDTGMIRRCGSTHCHPWLRKSLDDQQQDDDSAKIKRLPIEGDNSLFCVPGHLDRDLGVWDRP